MAKYRVKKIRGYYYVQKKIGPIWVNIADGACFVTSNIAIDWAQRYIESNKNNGAIIWESKE